jgi:hypothetical protein
MAENTNAKDFTGYGGLSEDNPAPSEVYTNYSSSRWPPKDASGNIKSIGNYFEIKKRDEDGKIIALRPRGNGDARIYRHSPNDEFGSPSARGNVLKLWVNEIIVGWGMEYQQGQGVFGKTFYPKHIKYTDAIVRGQTASQAHYDEIVKTVIESQEQALVRDPDVVRFHLPGLSYVRDSNSERIYDKVTSDSKKDIDFHMYGEFSFDGYITGISAGHKKGVFNPEFELRFAVVGYAGDSVTSIKNLDPSALTQAYRDSLDYKKATTVKSYGAVFESGYGPGGNQGPKT